MKKTLTIAETAEMLGISEKALRQRIARGEIPFRRWGRRVFIIASELETFLIGLPGVSAEDAIARKERSMSK